jgi:hypothetical protein
MQVIFNKNIFRKATTLFVLTLMLSIFLPKISIGKGCSGTYFISGTVYSVNKTVLKNVTITVKFGNETNTVLTDSNGHFEIELKWASACPSGRTKARIRKANEKINPKYIYIEYSNKKIKLDNKWKVYADCFPDSKDKITWKKNLYFSSE